MFPGDDQYWVRFQAKNSSSPCDLQKYRAILQWGYRFINKTELLCLLAKTNNKDPCKPWSSVLNKMACNVGYYIDLASSLPYNMLGKNINDIYRHKRNLGSELPSWAMGIRWVPTQMRLLLNKKFCKHCIENLKLSTWNANDFKEADFSFQCACFCAF